MAGTPREKKPAFVHLWGFLTSRRVAIVLGLALLLTLLLGLFFPQTPTDRDADGLARWWEQARARYGSRLDLYDRLGLLHLHRTPLFLALAAALLLNTLACTLERLGRLWRTAMRRPRLCLPEGTYEEADWPRAGMSLPQLRRALRWRGYRVWAQTDPAGAEAADRQPAAEIRCLCAVRFPWAPLGTVLTHLGLLLLLLAIVLQAGFSWREPFVVDPSIRLSGVPDPTGREGQALEHLSLRVLHSQVEIVHHDGAPRQIHADLGLLQGDQGGDIVSTEGAVGPADPLPIRGATLFWNSYGLALRLAARDAEDHPAATVFSSGEDLLYFPEGTTEGRAEIPSLGVDVTLLPSPAALAGVVEEPITVRVTRGGTQETVLEESVVPPGVVRLPNGQIELNNGIYLALEVVHNPGAPWFIAGGVILALGSALSLWFPGRRLWARLSEEGRLQISWGTRDRRSERRPAHARRGGTP